MLQINQDKVNLIMSLYREGKSYREIERMTKINKTTVHRYVTEEREKNENKSYDQLNEMQSEINRLYLTGFSKTEISESFEAGKRKLVNKEINYLMRNNYLVYIYS